MQERRMRQIKVFAFYFLKHIIKGRSFEHNLLCLRNLRKRYWHPVKSSEISLGEERCNLPFSPQNNFYGT